MLFRQIQDLNSAALGYLIADCRSGLAIAIDPPSSQDLLTLAMVQEHGLTLGYILRTHTHPEVSYSTGILGCLADVIYGLGERAQGLAVPLLKRLRDNEVIMLGADPIKVIATPGHTPGCISYLWRDRLFCGDALEINGCGQPVSETDLGLLYDSVTRKIFALPEETLIFPGHDYSGRTVSTVKEEQRRNQFFSGKTRAEFMRELGAH